MPFTIRTLPGTLGFRPQPTLLQDPTLNLHVIMATWGDRAIEAKLFELIKKTVREGDPVLAAVEADPEATQLRASPSQKSSMAAGPPPSLSAPMRGLQRSNEWLLQNENQKQWRSAVEMVILVRKRQNLTWAHTAGLQMFVQQPSGFELLSQLQGQMGQTLLPFGALGLDPQAQYAAGSVWCNEATPLLLMGALKFAPQLLQQPVTDLQQIVDIQMGFDGENPQWIALSK